LGQSTVKNLPNGIRFCYLPADKFKTITINVFIHQDLREELASQTALLPSLLERGTWKYPDSLSLRREMENLYGAELSTDVGKKGERHLMVISLELVRPDLLPEGDILRGGLNLLRSVLCEPLVENGGFPASYVEQEKEQLSKEIRGLINEKTTYSIERCVQEMCRGERFEVYKYGDLENLKKTDPAGLYTYYREVISSNPIDVYMVGPESVPGAGAMLEEVLDFPREEKPREIEETRVYVRKDREVLFKEEVLPVNQAKLVLGYRTNVDYSHPLYYPLLFFNGVLGGFPHSKLFQNVREKASLAYFVFSRLEKHKGIMIVTAGIDYQQYKRTLDLMQKQVKAVADGEITGTEMENTRRGLLNQLSVQKDSPSQLISFYLDSHMGGRDHTFEEVMQKLQQVTREEVVEVARRVELDTVYLLRGEKGE